MEVAQKKEKIIFNFNRDQQWRYTFRRDLKISEVEVKDT